MLNNLDIQPGAVVNRWIVGIKLSQFELVHVPGHLHTGPDGLSCHATSPNNLIDEDEDGDDWLDRTMSFAVVLMNSWPSWSSRLNSSYRPTQVAPYRPISYRPNCQKPFPTYLIYLEDKGPKGVLLMSFPVLIWLNVLMTIWMLYALCYSIPLPPPTFHSLASAASSVMHPSFSYWMASSCVRTPKAVTKSLCQRRNIFPSSPEHMRSWATGLSFQHFLIFERSFGGLCWMMM